MPKRRCKGLHCEPRRGCGDALLCCDGAVDARPTRVGVRCGCGCEHTAASAFMDPAAAERTRCHVRTAISLKKAARFFATCSKSGRSSACRAQHRRINAVDSHSSETESLAAHAHIPTHQGEWRSAPDRRQRTRLYPPASPGGGRWCRSRSSAALPPPASPPDRRAAARQQSLGQSDPIRGGQRGGGQGSTSWKGVEEVSSSQRIIAKEYTSDLGVTTSCKPIQT